MFYCIGQRLVSMSVCWGPCDVSVVFCQSTPQLPQVPNFSKTLAALSHRHIDSTTAALGPSDIGCCRISLPHSIILQLLTEVTHLLAADWKPNTCASISDTLDALMRFHSTDIIESRSVAAKSQSKYRTPWRDQHRCIAASLCPCPKVCWFLRGCLVRGSVV